MSRIADLRSRFETPSSNAASTNRPNKPHPVPTTGRRLFPPGATSAWGFGTSSTGFASTAVAAVPSSASPSSRSVTATATVAPESTTAPPPTRLVHLHDVVAPPGTGALMASERRAAEAELDAAHVAEQQQATFLLEEKTKVPSQEATSYESENNSKKKQEDLPGADDVSDSVIPPPSSPPPALMMTELDGTTLANPFATTTMMIESGSVVAGDGDARDEQQEDSTAHHFSTISLGEPPRDNPPTTESMSSNRVHHHKTCSSTSSSTAADWSAKEASRAGRAGRNSALYGPPALPPLVKDPSSTIDVQPHFEHPDTEHQLQEEFERARRASARRSGGVGPTGEAGAGEAAEGSEEAQGIDWSFWGRVMNDYQDVAQNHPEELSSAIQAGVPDALRGMVWQLMSGSKNEELELIFAYYLKEQQHLPAATSIRHDVTRTLSSPENNQFGRMEDQLNIPPNASAVGNIVAAYSLYDPACGPCAGIQYLVAALVGVMPDEEAFSTLVRLMRVYDLRGHYSPGFPSLQLRLYQLTRLVEEHAPLLHAHLSRQKVKVAEYAAPWLMTAFAYRFPLELGRRVLDAVFAEGLEVLFRFALTLLLQNEPRLLECGEHDDALRLLQTKEVLQPWSSDQGPAGTTSCSTYDLNALVTFAFSLRIDALDLDTYANEFEHKVRAAAAHRREMDSLTLVHRNLRNRVDQLKETATAQSAEHVELTKQIVVANLTRDEMAAELARYKMLYAEAVLAVDQARVQSTVNSGLPGASTSPVVVGPSAAPSTPLAPTTSPAMTSATSEATPGGTTTTRTEQTDG